MAILNYTTTISAEKSANEIQSILAAHGVKRVQIEYNDDRELCAVEFEFWALGQALFFRLPANSEGVYNAMKAQKRKGKINISESKLTRAQASRVAWRIVKDWVEAQMALIEAEMASLEETFFPYLLMPDQRTAFEHSKTKLLALPQTKEN